MTEDEFFQLEMSMQEQLNEFVRACEQIGFDPKDRIEDMMVNA